jgi:hypothetical protein
MQAMGLIVRLAAMLRPSRRQQQSLPAHEDGGDVHPIFDTLARACDHDGLIGWAFEDHGGQVSTAWTTLCAALDFDVINPDAPLRQPHHPGSASSAPAPARRATYTAPPWRPSYLTPMSYRSSRWRHAPSTGSPDGADPTAH